MPNFYRINETRNDYNNFLRVAEFYRVFKSSNMCELSVEGIYLNFTLCIPYGSYDLGMVTCTLMKYV
jgi:hypothetical protein